MPIRDDSLTFRTCGACGDATCILEWKDQRCPTCKTHVYDPLQNVGGALVGYPLGYLNKKITEPASKPRRSS
jgi:hypothetical protein